MGRYTSVTASRMTDAYGASTPAGVPRRRLSCHRAVIRKGVPPARAPAYPSRLPIPQGWGFVGDIAC